MLSKRKGIIIFIVLISMGLFQHGARAEEAGKIQQLESDINALKKAALLQNEKIRALESRVATQGAALSANASSSRAGKSAAGAGPDKLRQPLDTSGQKYID